MSTSFAKASSPRREFEMRRLIYLRDLLRELVVRDFKLRYNRSILGIGWSLLAPLAQLGILSFVFRVVVPVDIPNYTIFLFAGLLPWAWFSSSLLAAATAARGNKDLVQQVGFPIAVLPVISVASEFLHMVLALPILVFLMTWNGQPLSMALAALPAIALLQFAITLALAFFVAPLQMVFHDTEHLLRIALLLLFYVSAIFYSPDSVPKEFEIYYTLNPLVYLLTAYRTILIDGAWPSAVSYVAWFAVAVVLLIASYRFYMRLHFRFIQEL